MSFVLVNFLKLRQEESIGSGFRFDGEFDCGVIKEISPMFLKNRDDEILIKAPFNGKISDKIISF